MKNKLLHDGTFLTGIILIIISLLVFFIPEMFHPRDASDDSLGIFAINYLISIIYFVVLIIQFGWKAFRNHIEYGFLHLLLCLISAYSLNRELIVFEKSTTWLQIALIMQGLVLIALFLKDTFPRWIQSALFVLLGIIFILFLYLSIYLLPMVMLSIAFFFVLGISLHTLIPLGFATTIIFYLLRKDNRNKLNISCFGAGIFLSLVFITVFVIRWNETSRIISRASDASLLNEKNVLPEWVNMAQKLPKNAITEKFLKTDLVYSTAPDDNNWNFFSMPGRGFDEERKHDPLIMISTFFIGRPSLSNENKINILESMYDSRHQAQKRLWMGDDLKTSHIITNVSIYPSVRLSYTEKIITINNNLPKQTWRGRQEAIYTFHLPEGAVVTSLSLWIKGVEQKAVLTSKHKADSAYNTIVGIEQHDPSMVHWQEGNTISVRVFPCTPEEERRFKIGVTAPLRNDNNQLICENIWFDGPSAFMTRESIQLKMMDTPEDLKIPFGFTKTKNGEYVSEGRYQQDWKINMAISPIKPNSFSFDGKSYKVSEVQKTYLPFNFQNIYIDLNQAWTKEEFDQIRHQAKTINCYVFSNKLIKITDQNAAELFEELHQFNFSIFPLYVIKTPENSVFISKGTPTSPNLSDLKNSDFQSKLQTYLLTRPNLRFFNIGQERSPYLKTLKELRLFTYDSGSIPELLSLFSNKKFVSSREDDHHVVIDDAGIKITETNDSTSSNAPDHLMRLFAYNSVMALTGVQYFEKDFYNEDIIEKAHRAYVVSPGTSLVVLETKQDYERFAIKDDGTSLKNASMKSSGAVPEPHEWVLILMVVGVLIFVIVKR